MILNNYIEEFIAITDFLLKSKKYKKTLDYLIIPKTEIQKFLDKNKFDTSQNKLKIWKALNWINAEDERVTRRRYDRETGKLISCILIDIKVFEMMKKLNEK